MKRRVLIPLDGTLEAEAALDVVRSICERGDEVVLLAVQKPATARRDGFGVGSIVPGAMVTASGMLAETLVPDAPVYAETDDQAQQSLVDESQDYLHALAARLGRQSYDVRTEVLVSDKPDAAIIDYARRTHPTFIIITRRTHLSLGDRFFGRTASGVARSDVAPVLLIAPA